jgi:flagellar basal-body rod protein FlgG
MVLLDPSAQLRRGGFGYMINALHTAATGMRAQQSSMDVVANNLANATTTGFKRDRLDLVDLDYRPLLLAEGGVAQVGLGSAPGSIAKEHEQGALQQTGGPLDVAIEGEGFLQVVRSDGTLAYTRAGNLQVDALGRMGLRGGELLQPRITVPPGAGEVTIAPDGQVSASVNGNVRNLGRIQTASFANPGGLAAVGDSLFAATANSGAAALGAPGAGGRGALTQGALEASNVNVGTEMISLITTQRAFEAASKVVTASDEMMGMANGLRR